MEKNQPIGVFDSGLGGVSVLRELVALMPNENYIYFGDSVNAPYGTKSDSEIMELSDDVMENLVNQGCKAIVIGCNTITGVAAKRLRAEYPKLIIVATEPAVKPAVAAAPKGKILVMATTATLRSKRFMSLVDRFGGDAEIISCPCPGLMEFVERGEIYSENLRQYLTEKITGVGGMDADCAVLGCTHYPFVKGMIQEVLGDKVKIFDGAPGIARQLKRKLKAYDLINDSGKKGTIHWENSLNNPELLRLSEKLLNLQ